MLIEWSGLIKIGDILCAQGNLSGALEAYQAGLDIRQALDIAGRLETEGKLAPTDAWMVGDVRARLTATQAE